MKVKVFETKNNVNFIRDENNRPLFLNADGTQSDVLKKAWESKHFSDNYEEGTMSASKTLNASVTIKYDDYAKIRAINYVKIEVNKVIQYFFVEEVEVVNEEKAKLYLYLDVITTYFDKLNFGGSAKIERKHFDRYYKKDGKFIRNIDQKSPIWNKETDLNIEPSLPLLFLQMDLANQIEKQKIQEHYKIFGHNGSKNLLFGMYNPTTKDKKYMTGGRNQSGLMPYIKNIAPLIEISKANQNINYCGIIFDESNNLDIFNNLTSPKLSSIISTILPLAKVWEIYDGGGTPYRVDFKVEDIDEISNIAYHGTDLNAKYLIETTNPIYQELDPKVITLNDPLNNENEPKLFTGQFLKLELMNYKRERKIIINKYLDPSENKLQMIFTEKVTSTEQKTIIEIADGEYVPYNSDFGRFVFNNYEQIPSYSSAYSNFEQNHLRSYKTGLLTNRVQTGLGIGSSLIGAMTGNPMSAMGALGVGVNGIFNEMKMKANVEDLQHQAIQEKGSSTSAITDFDFIANDIFDQDKLPFGIAMTSLTDFQKNVVTSYLAKYGYETDNLENIQNYQNFLLRSRYSYWKAPKISKAIKKDLVGREILSELDKLFDQGITFWSINENGEGEFNDYTKENWEKDIYAEIKANQNAKK